MAKTDWEILKTMMNGMQVHKEEVKRGLTLLDTLNKTIKTYKNKYKL